MEVERKFPEKPTVFTVERCAEILRILEAGNRLSVALSSVNISKHTFRYWEQRVKAGDPTVPDTIMDFFVAMKVAEAQSEISALDRVREGKLGWQGSAWFLERRYPNRWGRPDPYAKLPERAAEAIGQSLRDYLGRGKDTGHGS